jgi:hypothetical protein
MKIFNWITIICAVLSGVLVVSWNCDIGIKAIIWIWLAVAIVSRIHIMLMEDD